ncbi:6-phosphogluconolactonase [Burkholderiales bacterium GJ-E10]|nr:6-phosphogluconolactonase [Burkholderiales bacterium GJ-E10]
MAAVQICRWREFSGRVPFERAAERFILDAAEDAIAKRDAFRARVREGVLEGRA